MNSTPTLTPIDPSVPKKVTELQASLAVLATDFPVFVQAAFAVLYPGKPFMENWHIDAMAHALEGCIEGSHRRLIINVPPRHLKSFICSVAFPAFVLGMDPTAKIIVASYSEDLAKPLALDFRRLVESPLYKQVFPKMVAMKSTETEFHTNVGGSRLALSVGGSLTGKGADFIIVDDPLKAQDAGSDKERQRVNRWFGETLYSRLDDKKHSVLIVVMQRLHVNDLTGYLLQGQADVDKEASQPFHHLSAANEPVLDAGSHVQQGSPQIFKHLCFPAIAQKTETFALSKVKAHTRNMGDLLHPEREDDAALADVKQQMGSLIFAAQYQQAPQMPEGMWIKSSWIETVPDLPANPGDATWVLCIDAASSTQETADYTALVFMYVCEKGCYVVDVKRGRWDYETLKAIVQGYEHKYGDGGQFRYLVEDTSVGTALISELKAQGKSVFTDKPTTSKAARVYRSLPVMEKGCLKVVKHPSLDSRWIEPFVAELVSFPNVRFDDQLDATVMGVHWANWHWTQHRWLREGVRGQRVA